MNLAQRTNELTLEELQTLWRSKNRNAVSEIRVKFDLSRTTIERVIRGEIASGERRVEKELARRGCPGFEQYEQNPIEG